MEQNFHDWKNQHRRRLLIFDADGTLRRCTVHDQVCPNRPGEWELMPGVKARMAKFQWSPDLLMGIASNQGGVALGYLSEADAYQLLKDLFVEVSGAWPTTGLIQLCPHAPDAGCECRKPRPLMLQNIMRAAGFSPAETVFVGDQVTDEEAAQAAGVNFVTAADFFGWGGDQ